MFQGVSYSNLDAKGRVAIPSRHREFFQEKFGVAQTLVVTVHHRERCLVVRPPKVWKTVAARVRESTGTKEGEQRLKLLGDAVRLEATPQAAMEAFRDQQVSAEKQRRKLLGSAQELSLDSAGRILLGAFFRNYARMEKKVAVSCLGDHLELWNAADWEKQMEAPVGDLLPGIAELNL